jgi:DNA helicase-2/ATP-dependent DNA helicase PcrA
MKLTRAQEQAVTHNGRNLQLIACAGSGKTEVVARRVVHLLTPGRRGALQPRNIIAFTFTDKAAAELKQRIVTRTRAALGDIPGMAEMFVGTIHAFCLELLKSESPKYLKYEVLNEVQQALFVDRHSSKSGLTTSTDLTGAPLRRYKDTNRFIAALSILREAERDDANLTGCSLLGGLAAYSALLEERSYLDYSSILDAAVDALTNDVALRERLAERIKYVIVDEYQDVNPVQEAIVWSLHEIGARICVVGDDDQTIYQWRGSDVENILSFANRYPGVDTIPIEENFRSSDGIVETARPFIEQNTARLPKAMKPTGAQPYEPGDIAALAFASPDEEAQHIVATAQALRGVAFAEDGRERGLAWSDMAVLLRSVKANAEPITQALRAAGIPFVVTGMSNLFGTAEADAARQLFYFMADRGPDIAAVEQAWQSADLGLDPGALRSALRGAAADKAALTSDDQKRWGQYSIQRVFLNFLERAGVREEQVPNGRGEVVFYNLGKFSQVISDFESIHFHSKPAEKYASFADFLAYRAEDAYPEGWQDNQYANPDAVRIMTVHQAKGMQWPVVFLPALLRNRFPAARIGGPGVWHLLPRDGIKGQARFEGTVEDERRLFYVAMTRSQKFLHMTWAPIAGKNNRYARASEFWENILVSKYVKRRPPDYSARKRIPPQPRAGVSNVVFSFSDLKYFFECPYQFKLRVLYGFNPPIHEALGYGKSLHDVLAEVHKRAIDGDIADAAEVPRLLERHMHTPYAYLALRQQLEASAERVVREYLTQNRSLFDKIEFSEKQIEINLGDGVSVVGRIDLVRRIDTGETTIVDLKSSDRAQAEDVTETQLHVYALGYQELTGRRPDYVEIYELDDGKRKPRSVDDDFIVAVKARANDAASALRSGTLPPKPNVTKCGTCDYQGMCTPGRKVGVAR